VQTARPRNLWPMSAYSLCMLHKAGLLCLHRSRGQPERQCARPRKQQSACQRRFRSFAELSGLGLLKLPSDRGGKRCRALLPRCAPYLIRSLIFDLQDSRVNHRSTRKTYLALGPTLPRIPAPLPLGICDSRSVRNCYMRDTLTGGLYPLPGSSPHPSKEVQQPTKWRWAADCVRYCGAIPDIDVGIPMGSGCPVSIWA
jgi:hypothetical protein